MFVNLHELAHDCSFFTLAVTSQPVGTPEDELLVDEIDVVAKRSLSVKA
jgi:hypothetical protein